MVHFKTYRTSHEKDTDPDPDDLIDSTHDMGIGPFELLMGREFKLPVWEEMVKTMKVGEVARFGCEYSVSIYSGTSIIRHSVELKADVRIQEFSDYSVFFSMVKP